MNRTLATVLNFLDALRTRLEYEKFRYSAIRDASGNVNVEIKNLKVWVYFDQHRYFIAQGLDIGYVASARSLDEVTEKFIRGLATTLVINVQKTGTIDGVVVPAPPDIWLKWRRAVRSTRPHEPKHIVSEPPDVVPGLQAPTPKLELSFYGCPA